MIASTSLKRITQTILGFAVLAVAGIASATTITTLFDNGTVVEADLGLRFNFGDHTVYDDFVLTADSTITGFEWSQFDEPVTYTDTILTLFDGLPTPSSHIATFAVVATRNSNGLMLMTDKVTSGEVFGFDYLVDGLSTPLSAGTYYLGIYNNVSGGATLIANTPIGKTIGSFQFSHLNATPPLFGLTESGPTFQGSHMAFRVSGIPTVSVSIDIKPGSDPNAINPRSKGATRVAILTVESFDAPESVNPSTVHFGPSGAGIHNTSVHFRDVDHDGDLDLVLHFQTQETGIACGDTEASLSGTTFDGTPIAGSDSIVTVGCK